MIRLRAESPRRRVVRAWQEGASAPTVDPVFLDLVVCESLKAPAAVWREAFGGLLRTDLTAALGAIDAPTLILSGGLDAMCHAEEDLAEAALRRVRRRRLDGAGHAPHWEDPTAVARGILAFVEAELGAAAPRCTPDTTSSTPERTVR